MTLGDVFEIVVPSRLAFGPVSVGKAFRRTMRATVPAYSTLVFKVHVDDILAFESGDSKKLKSAKAIQAEL